MTRPTWTLDHIREELDWVMQYGKGRVMGVPKNLCPHAVEGVITECNFGTCSHPVGEWQYGWFCWCGEGYSETTWDKAMREMEIHMWGGLHK